LRSLPEIRFRASGWSGVVDVAPITVETAPFTRTPSRVFPRASLPSLSVPILFPCTVFTIVLSSRPTSLVSTTSTPVPFAEMTLP
jgi:hypothetical protein